MRKLFFPVLNFVGKIPRKRNNDVKNNELKVILRRRGDEREEVVEARRDWAGKSE